MTIEPHVGSRITDKFPVQSDSGHIRMVICAQDHAERSSPGTAQKYYVPTGLTNYYFEDGDPVAKIGDAFLDRSGEIYRRFTQ